MEAVVLRIDREKERLSLGYKQLTRDPWEDAIPARYHVGDSVAGKVSKVADFGVFIELEGGVEGLIHIGDVQSRPFMPQKSRSTNSLLHKAFRSLSDSRPKPRTRTGWPKRPQPWPLRNASY